MKSSRLQQILYREPLSLMPVKEISASILVQIQHCLQLQMLE